MFQFRQEQFAALRRKKIGDGLIATFAEGPVRAGWSERKNYVIASDPLDNQTRFGFDEHGFIAAVASPMGRLWQIGNYADGKPAVLRNPAGHELGITYTPAGLLNSISSNGALRLQLHYNERQVAVAAGFPDGTFSAAEYTPWGAPWVMTNRLGLRDLCEYDEHRRLTALTDGNGNRTGFVYGSWTRPDSTVFPNGTSESYAYSEKGFVTEIATEESRVELEPDDKGRPAGLRYSDGVKISYKYDDQGRTAEAAQAEHVCKFAWNDAGLLESEKCGDDEVAYQYDKAGRLVATTLPSGEKIGYEWDADSRLTLVRDWSGGEHRIQYAANDRGSLLTAPNGVDTLTVLNNVGRPESIAVSMQGRPLFSLGYGFDNEDRVVSLRDSAFGYRDFRYDPEGQLLAADSQGESASESFAYDGAGNAVDVNGKTAQHDSANQMMSLGHSVYEYDRRGNLVCMDTAEGTWRFTWSARNLMARSESPSGVVTKYAYDAFGRRIGKQREGLAVEFQWAGEQMIAEIVTTAESVVRRDYLYYPGTFTPLAVRVDGEVYSYHCDHLGTPRMICAADGTTVWLADYASFGGARVVHEALRNLLRAPGQYFDEETGLHYNRFRYYSPQLGRYLSRDPLGFVAGTNFYSYAANSPINKVDPLGLFSGTDALVLGGSILAAVAVGAAVVALAPAVGLAGVALVLAGGLLAGAAGGATAEALNEKLNNQNFCLPCILKAAGYGAVAGTVAAAAFLLFPAAAGVGAIAAKGALGGALSYVTNLADGASRGWNTKDFLTVVAVSAVTAGVVRYAAGRVKGPVLTNEAPAPGSLTDIQARDWYNGKVTEIKKVELQMRADGESSEDIFNTTTQMRNDAKLQARDLMQNQELAKSLPPPKTPEEVLAKYGGDYEKAITGSQRTNVDVNQTIEDRRLSGEE